MSPSTPDKDALLPRAELRDEVVVFAKTLIVREMKAQKLTYQTLADRLAPYGIRDSAAVLNTKVYRGTFSAVFLITCLKALGIGWVNLSLLDLTAGGPARRLNREHYEEETNRYDQSIAKREKREQKVMRARVKRAKGRAKRAD